jgi:hypothetical protein
VAGQEGRSGIRSLNDTRCDDFQCIDGLGGVCVTLIALYVFVGVDMAVLVQ